MKDKIVRDKRKRDNLTLENIHGKNMHGGKQYDCANQIQYCIWLAQPVLCVKHCFYFVWIKLTQTNFEMSLFLKICVLFFTTTFFNSIKLRINRTIFSVISTLIKK